MSQATGSMVYVAAVLFAIGVTYFWPTMLGCVAEYTPKTGALGMSLIGGAGMFAVSLWNPVIGSWIDAARTQAQAANIDGQQADLLAGQAVLGNILLFPAILIFAFLGFYFYIKNNKGAPTHAQVATSKE